MNDIVTASAENAAKQTGVKKKVRTKARPAREAFVYLGPNLPGGELMTGAVYREKPPHITALAAIAPELDGLFVDVKEAARFKAELGRAGTEAHRLYQSILNATLQASAGKGGGACV